MVAVNYNFIIEQGSDFEINFQYNDANGNPVDLSDSSSTCVVLQTSQNNSTTNLPWFSTNPSTPDVNYSFTANNQGLITLKINNVLTKTYTFDSINYDLDLIQGSKITRLTYGTITLEKRQTPFPNCQLQSSQGSGSDNGGTDGEPGGPGTGTDQPGSQINLEDLCLPTDCLNTDIYASIYNGSGLTLSDAGLPLSDNSASSGYVVVNNTGYIENVEFVVNNLNHTHPQDLQLFLCPPSGNKILLAANHKIPNNSGNFSFMFSNKSQPGSYLHNVTNGGLCNIYDKTSIIKYSNENLSGGFDHLPGNSVTGVWTFLVKDTDPLSSGTIGGWKLVITYQ